MTRSYINSHVKDSELADAIESCYRRWMKEYHPLFLESED